MDQGRKIRKHLSVNRGGGNRRMGRPRLRWLADVQKDLWEMKFNL